MLHSNKINTLDFSGQSIYAGMDVHNESWKICIFSDEFELKPMTTPPDPGILIRHLRKNYPGANYKCAYEAGYSGFWIQQEFKKQGIECIVVNPADVPSTNKEQVYKSDPVDCRKIARSLRNGELEAIYVPDRQALEDRNLVRMRHGIVKKQTRVKNQIKAFLSFYGIKKKDEDCKKSWTKKHIKYLESISIGQVSGNASYGVLLKELRYYMDTLKILTKQITELSANEKYREDVINLSTSPGINIISSMKILTELNDIRRFRSLDKLASYVGLIPSKYSTGDREIQRGITHRGNPFLKETLIECAWTAVKRDPALLMCFKKYCRTMDSNKAIIKIARKLLNRIRYILLNKEPYVNGIV